MSHSLIAIKASCSVPEKMHAQSVLEGQGLVGRRYPHTLTEVPLSVRHFFEDVTAAPAAEGSDSPFEEQYRAAMVQLATEFPGSDTPAPSLEEMQSCITTMLDDEVISFPTFEAFQAWWEGLNGYEELDTEMSVAEHLPLLRIAYNALVHEGVIAQGESNQATESAAPEANGSAVAAPAIVVSALERAEQFIEGFEDDEEQEGIAELLADLRAARREVTGEKPQVTVAAEKSFCLVFSNYTGNLLAWEGTADQIRKYLGNREIVGVVSAIDENSALAKWRMINLGTTSEEARA